MNRRVIVAAVFVVAIVAMSLIFSIGKPSPRPVSTFTFISYTNNGGQLEALFRLEYPPRRVFADGLTEISYQTPTGWARPSTPSVAWRYFGWDGTGSIAAITVETTNLPARVVMDFWMRRKGIGGVYDRLLDVWTKLTGKTPMLRGNVSYVTNQTVVLQSSP